MKAALVIHGFTATPSCMETVAQPLRDAGFLVRSPLLAGHGGSARDLEKTTWQDWYGSVRVAFQELNQKAESVSVVGQSLGGLLALKLAAEFSVAKLALLATPIFFKGFAINRVLPFVEGSFLKYIYRFQPKLFGSAISDPEGQRRFESNFWMPLKSVMEIVRLQGVVRGELPKITAPTLILHSSRDTTAPYESMEFLKKHLGSKKIKAVSLERSNHVLTLDYEKGKVAREVLEFLNK
jgi:carboxylesterase